MRGEQIEFFCERRDYGMVVAIYARATRDGKHFAAEPMLFETELGGQVAEPALLLETEVAQRLMDELWKAGLRPAAGKQSEGVTAAQDRHLQDMRALAFAKLGVDRP